MLRASSSVSPALLATYRSYSADPMKYFLLVYHQPSGRLDLEEEYSDAARQAALDRRFELEHLYRTAPDYEVVLLGARSKEDLVQTHARYFKSVRELARSA
jgi:hypothetical protein